MKIKFLVTLIILAAFISCGKKEKSSLKVEPYRPPVITEREEFLKKQELVCDGNSYCPEYVAKIVVFDRGSPRFCTGTLVSKTRVLTSASCLPNYLRTTDAECKEDVHIFFNNGSRPPERVACKSILQVSNLEGDKPEYWRDDVAVLELAKGYFWREQKSISRRGLGDGGVVRFFGVHQENNFTGIIRKEECEVVQGSYVYPLSANVSSPNVLLAGCSRKTGYRGAAILDSAPRIRAVLSDNTNLKAAIENNGLALKPLKDFVHVSNFACAPFMDETSVLDEVECVKNLDYGSIVNERSRLLSDELRFGDALMKFQKEADAASKYLRITARLVHAGNAYALDYKPVCFKSTGAWLSGMSNRTSFHYEVNFPARNMKKGVDANGRAATVEGDEAQTSYYFNFSPKRLVKEELSDVFVDTDNTDTVRVSAIKACPN